MDLVKKERLIAREFTGKTPWDGGYAYWLLRYGHDWIPEEDVIFEKNKKI